MADRYLRGTRWRNPRTGTVWRVARRWTSGWGGATWITLVSDPKGGHARGRVRHMLAREIDDLTLEQEIE